MQHDRVRQVLLIKRAGVLYGLPVAVAEFEYYPGIPTERLVELSEFALKANRSRAQVLKNKLF